MPGKTARKLHRLALWILVLVVLTATTATGWYALKRIGLKFHPKEWAQARRDEDWTTRTKMATDLIVSNMIVGKTRAELIAMLGDPEAYSDVPSNELHYEIREDWRGIDISRRDNLVIVVDKNGRAAAADIKVFLRPKFNLPRK